MILERLKDNAVLPTKGTINSAGWDLTAIDYKIKDNGIVMFDTGWKGEIATNCFGAIYIRSGIATKGVWTLANSVGVIDSDYRGPIKVVLRYLNPRQLVHVEDIESDRSPLQTTPLSESIKDAADELVGQRIAQIVIQPFMSNGVEFGTVNDTKRGEGGFGSTG